jgi:hypothetical protein
LQRQCRELATDFITRPAAQAAPEGHAARLFRRSNLWRQRDMVAWKMIGFPGARYDYRDWVDHHNTDHRAQRSSPSSIA